MRVTSTLLVGLAVAAALSAPSFSSPRSTSALPVFAGCTGTAQPVRPRRILIACGDGSFYLTAMRWSRWTSRDALGTGTGHENDCTPDCAHGHYHAYPISVRLSAVKTCKRGRREFTRLAWRWIRKPPGVTGSGAQPFLCR
jgi:hypothetical protein